MCILVPVLVTLAAPAIPVQKIRRRRPSAHPTFLGSRIALTVRISNASLPTPMTIHSLYSSHLMVVDETSYKAKSYRPALLLHIL